jgi:hypothetical protein
MPTLLEAANEALLLVGEREVLGLTSPVGRKALLAVKRSQVFVGNLHAWRHLRQRITNTANWVGGVATLPPFSEVTSVLLRPGIEIRRISPTYLRDKQNDDATVQTGTPSYFCVVGDNKVELYPAPSSADRLNISFSVVAKPVISQNATDVLEGPDEYSQLVSLYAQVILHRCHTTDLNAAEATVREFETSVHMQRTRDNLSLITYMG